MARKGLLDDITRHQPTHSPARSIAAITGRGAFGAVSRSIDDLAEQAGRAKELEAKLVAGELIVDIEPEMIDVSIASDRMDRDDAIEDLVQAIRERGQDSPILVRPHPSRPGRYQVAFGHRRLRAAKTLGIPVRAVVKVLDDQSLVLAQGQENSARQDLSFIERARFATKLEAMEFDRTVIMSALSVDKTELSRMINVASALPIDMIEAIGRAPSIGRRRWMDLVQAFNERGAQWSPHDMPKPTVDETSDERFERVLTAMRLPSPPQKPDKPLPDVKKRYWSPPNAKASLVAITENDSTTVLRVDRRVDQGFGDFIVGVLDELFDRYKTEIKEGV